MAGVVESPHFPHREQEVGVVAGGCCGVRRFGPRSRICWVFRGYPRRTYPRLHDNAGREHQEDALREHLMLTRESATAVLAC
jgi:hypothetical protein